MNRLNLSAITLGGPIDRRIRVGLRHLLSERERILNGEGFGSTWGADQAGRWLGAVALAAEYTGEKIPELEEVCSRLVAAQNSDGFFGTRLTSSTWWGAGRGLIGLLEYWAATRDRQALDAAIRLGQFYLAHLPLDGPGLVTQHGGHEEGLVALWRATGDRVYLELAERLPGTVEEDFGVPGNPSPNHHTHSYLSVMRGCVDLYRANGDVAFLRRAQDTWEQVVAHQMWVTGGISEGSGYPFETRDETCSVADWLRLSLRLWQTTGEPRYIEVAEHVLLNHLAFDQDHSGGFCTFRSVSPDRSGSVRDVVAWFCCSMSGLRALLEATRFVYTHDGSGIYVNLYLPSRAEVALPGRTVILTQTGDYPSREPVRLAVEGAGGAELSIRIRIPAWSTNWQLVLNGTPVAGELEGGYVEIRRIWNDRDELELSLEPRLAVVPAGANGFAASEVQDDVEPVALKYGPLVLMLDPVLNVYEMFDWGEMAITVARGEDGAPCLPQPEGRVPGRGPLAAPGACFLTTAVQWGVQGDREALAFLVPVAEVTDRWTYTLRRSTPYEVRNRVEWVEGDAALAFMQGTRAAYDEFARLRGADTTPMGG